jgi:hypothetical protein
LAVKKLCSFDCGSIEKIAQAASLRFGLLRPLHSGRRSTRIAFGGWRQSAWDGFHARHIFEATMKSILSMALVFGVGGLVSAADDKKVDPVGTWKCEYKIGDQLRTSTLTLKKDGDKVTGLANLRAAGVEILKGPE